MTRIAIIGAGISGLAAASAIEDHARQSGLDLTTLVIEKQERVGGKIWSIKEEGYLCEWGPNGFLDNKPMTLDFCRRLQIDERLLRSDDNARKRHLKRLVIHLKVRKTNTSILLMAPLFCLPS